MIALVPIGAPRRSDLVKPVSRASCDMEQLNLVGIRITQAALLEVVEGVVCGLDQQSREQRLS